MSYIDRANLVADADFMGRLNACVANEAVGKPADPFVNQILRAWGWGGQAFAPVIISLPGFDKPQAEITDGDLLAGVQASWDRVADLAGLVSTA